MATVAAILGQRAERALVFIKRMSKRYQLIERDYLLQALVLAQLGKATIAVSILDKHGLGDYRMASNITASQAESIGGLIWGGSLAALAAWQSKGEAKRDAAAQGCDGGRIMPLGPYRRCLGVGNLREWQVL
ncbi:MAG: hypothetical protein HQL37_04665 [Alphaproteobacteria bacterium]|nr:hypothetical protein [Alphaproteobacteria bacterium]